MVSKQLTNNVVIGMFLFVIGIYFFFINPYLFEDKKTCDTLQGEYNICSSQIGGIYGDSCHNCDLNKFVPIVGAVIGIFGLILVYGDIRGK